MRQELNKPSAPGSGQQVCFYGVIYEISAYNADFNGLQDSHIQKIGADIQSDLVFFTDFPLIPGQDVEIGIPGLVHILILVHLLFQIGQIFPELLRSAVLQNQQMIFHIMVQTADLLLILYLILIYFTLLLFDI